MPEHITLFCRSESFVQCHQYAIGCVAIQAAVERCERVNSDNRRKLERIKAEVPVNIAVSDATGKSQLVFGAITLDMSLEGIRIQTQEALPLESKVCFAFDDEFSVPNWKGCGEVRWTEKDEDNNLFESGMVVTDRNSCHAIGQHIGFGCFL
nr:PilZ domain-containing protein [Desulfobulbaceae bacterium]